MSNPFTAFDDVSRREFAAIAAKTFLGVGLLPVTGALPAFGDESEKKTKTPAVTGTAKNCIYLYMSGGMTHLHTLEPRLQDPSRPSTRRPLVCRSASIFRNSRGTWTRRPSSARSVRLREHTIVVST